MGMGIDQWKWEGMGILIVFPHTSNLSYPRLKWSNTKI